MLPKRRAPASSAKATCSAACKTRAMGGAVVQCARESAGHATCLNMRVTWIVCALETNRTS